MLTELHTVYSSTEVYISTCIDVWQGTSLITIWFAMYFEPSSCQHYFYAKLIKLQDFAKSS